jgi:Protein of unknown function (DUF4235)
MNMKNIAYRPVGMAAGVAGGVVGRAVFHRLWSVADRGRDAPQPTDEDRRWAEILIAAAVQGAIFAVIKAAVDRAGAKATGRLTPAASLD